MTCIYCNIEEKLNIQCFSVLLINPGKLPTNELNELSNQVIHFLDALYCAGIFGGFVVCLRGLYHIW